MLTPLSAPARGRGARFSSVACRSATQVGEERLKGRICNSLSRPVVNAPSCRGLSRPRSRARRARRRGASGSVVAGWGAEVFALEAVAVAFEREDLGVVDESVDHRDGGDLVAEDLAPGAEWLVNESSFDGRGGR
jgi:hypothetical protein